MPVYQVEFFAFEAREIRSGDLLLGKAGASDTVYCGIGLVHGNDAPNLNLGLGGNSVTAATGVSNFLRLACAPVTLVDGETCTMVWSAINCGHMDDNSRAGVTRRSLDLLTNKLDAVPFGAAPGAPNDLFADDVSGVWLDLLAAIKADLGMGAYSKPEDGCDGWVCGGAIKLTAADLWNRTANGNLNIYVLSHGYDAQDCGANSLYQSQLIVNRIG